MSQWQKIKHLFVADKQSDWMYSHASNAFYTHLEGSIGRVYFSCRDIKGLSHIAFLDVDLEDDFKIINVSDKAVLSPGPLGTFDDSGSVMAYLISINGATHLYYLGWNLKVTVPWLNTIGLATWNDQTKAFEKHSMAPIMDRSAEDPFSISYPSILYDNGKYRMWYGSNLSWGENQSDMKHVFKYAESDDGISWKRTNQIVLNFTHENEYALSKPFVIKDNDLYKMWYSFRGNGAIESYRIGYAESNDGLNWTRKDHLVGIDVSKDGWDSEMISYPCIFDYNGDRFMLYNGNGYGRTGFGIAKLV